MRRGAAQETRKRRPSITRPPSFPSQAGPARSTRPGQRERRARCPVSTEPAALSRGEICVRWR
eukprot:2221198-Pyramimonas_sp.AAC.1